MATDPFASLRSAPISGSLLPVVTPEGVTEIAQKTAPLPLLPALPRILQEEPSWRERAAHLMAEWALPREWAEGLAALQAMAMPAGAAPSRWAQIVEDARSFVTRLHLDAIAAGWSLIDVFGFDPDDGQSDCGLAVEIRGRATILLIDGVVVARGPDGASYFRPGEIAPGTAPIWEINRNRARRSRRHGQ